MFLLSHSASGNSQEYRIIDNVGLPVGLPSVLSLTLPQDLQPPSNICLWVSASISISCWIELLSGLLC